MPSLATFASFLLVSGLLVYVAAECGNDPSLLSKRITNGSPAVFDEFPYAVGLKRLSFTHACGGVLIDPEWVLTAASCFEQGNGLPSFTDISVQIGGLLLDDECAEARTGIPLIHPDWLGNTLDGNDIALIKLTEPSNRTVIKLPNFWYKPDAADVFMVIGWGRLSPRGPFAETLNKATSLQYLDSETCNRIHSRFDVQQMFCAGFSGTGPCAGDQGGPLIKEGQRDVVVGISTSVGSFQTVSCGQAGVPGLFTDVARHVKWIRSEIAKG